jgi:hypothetical protein
VKVAQVLCDVDASQRNCFARVRGGCLCVPNAGRGQEPVLGTAAEGVIPNDLARIVDAVGGWVSEAPWGIDRRVDTAAVEEGVF